MSVLDPVNGSWMALNAGSAGERSITLAILIMSANTSGIVGSQLFQQQDGPRYRTGWTAILGLVTAAVVSAVAANLQYWLLNRRRPTTVVAEVGPEGESGEKQRYHY